MKSGAEAGGSKIKTNLRHRVSSGPLWATQQDIKTDRQTDRGREKEREQSALVIGVFLYLCAMYVSSPQAESHSVALAVLEFTRESRLVLNSQRSTCLFLPSARIKGVCHHA